MWTPWRRKRKREIFEFRDGAGRLRRIDPMVAWRRMMADPELNAEEHFSDLGMVDKPELQLAAAEITAAAARRIFGLVPLSDDDASSVTDGEAAAILLDYLAWMELQKKSTSPSPTLPPAMAPTS